MFTRRSNSSHSISRGIALFIGCFTLMNLVGFALGNGANQNLWWVDFSILNRLPGSLGFACSLILQFLTGALLVWWALKPNCDFVRRVITVAALAIVALVALQNAIVYWSLLLGGAFQSALPVPLSLVIALALAACAWTVLTCDVEQEKAGWRPLAFVAAWALVTAFVFPLLQVCFFGTTDYRRPADAAVVLGAQVHEDGTLSRALAERMDTAVDLYGEGLAKTLIVSGGTGSEGVDEASAMARYAVSRGVPEDAIVVDSDGVSTEATVFNSLQIAEQRGIDTMIVTSSFYHMPRIKMAYLAKGADVLTVPTIGDMRDNGTAVAIWREPFAWWAYWLRNTLHV